MSNIIKIKHGNSPPTTDNLDNFELGWDKTNKKLYINNENEIVQVGGAEATALIDIFYPIGSLYWTQSKNDPNTMWPGTTWVQITNKFIYAVDSSNDSGKTGGSNNISITNDNLPNHSHPVYITSENATPEYTVSGTNANDSHTHTFSATSGSNGAHTHSVSGTAASAGSHKHTIGADYDGAGGSIWATIHKAATGAQYMAGSTNTTGAHTHSVSGTAASAGAHTHSVSGTTSSDTHTHTWSGSVSGGTHAHAISGSTNAVGMGASFSIMPSYETAYCWKRTA